MPNRSGLTQAVKPEARRGAAAAGQLLDERIDLLGRRVVPDGVVLDVEDFAPARLGLFEGQRRIDAAEQAVGGQHQQAWIVRPGHGRQRGVGAGHVAARASA